MTVSDAKIETPKRPMESEAAGEASAKATRVSDAAGAVRVLLADDNALNLRLVALMLQGKGMEVETARDGQEAYDKLVTACSSGTPPHAAILDLQMPRMSGAFLAHNER